MANVVIRLRHRVQASPKPGLRQSWYEYQVVQGRRIIHRADMLHQAERWAAKNGHVVIAKEASDG